MDQQYRATFGEQYETLRPSLRIGSRTINELIVSELILRDAERIGLTVGAEELAEAIRTTPQLQQDGEFVGREIYEDFIQRSYPGGVIAFEAALAQDLILQKWTEVMTQSVHVTNEELESLHRQRTEKTAIDYVVVSSADQQVEPSIPEAEVRAWYDGHPDDYMRPAGRTIKVMELTRDSLAESVGVTDDEVRASYDANISSYSHGDQRRARHILLRVDPQADEAARAEARESAEKILARLQGGEAFEPLAQTLSEDPISAARGGDLDFFGRGAMVAEFDTAVFGTPVGEFAPVTETQFGFHVIQVTDAREAGTTPLEQVREEIVSRLKTRRTQERVTIEAERISGRLNSGESFDGVAAAEGLEVQELFVERGSSLGQLGVIRPDAVDQIFSLGAGETSTPLDTRKGKAIVKVEAVSDSQVAPFEEVRERIRTDLLDEKMLQQAHDVATQATSGDWDLRTVASLLELEVRESGDLAPGTAPPGAGGSSEELQQTLFGDVPVVGDQGVARVPGGALIYSITRREPFDSEAFETARASLSQEVEAGRRLALRESILGKLRERSDVKINQTLVGQIDGLP